MDPGAHWAELFQASKLIFLSTPEKMLQEMDGWMVSKDDFSGEQHWDFEPLGGN